MTKKSYNRSLSISVRPDVYDMYKAMDNIDTKQFRLDFQKFIENRFCSIRDFQCDRILENIETDILDRLEDPYYISSEPTGPETNLSTLEFGFKGGTFYVDCSPLLEWIIPPKSARKTEEEIEEYIFCTIDKLFRSYDLERVSTAIHMTDTNFIKVTATYTEELKWVDERLFAQYKCEESD